VPDIPEQRQITRYLLQLPVLLKPLGPLAGRAEVGWTLNLSEAGTCVELANRLQPSTPLQARLQTIRGPIEMEGRVIWAEDSVPGKGVPHGAIFTRIHPDQLQALRTLVHAKGDKRQALRLPLDLAFTCHAKGKGAPQLQGRTGDMSRGGLLLHLPQILAPGTELVLTLATPPGPLTVEGVIAWVASREGRASEEPIRHGLRFTTLGWSTSLSLGLFLLFTAETPEAGDPPGQGHSRSG
jgi:PilZ domain